MDDDEGDYSTDKISAQLITKDTKRTAFTLPETKLFGKVLSPVLLVCHFTETKKRLLSGLQKTLSENIIPSNSAMKADQMDFRIIINICDILNCLPMA